LADFDKQSISEIRCLPLVAMNGQQVIVFLLALHLERSYLSIAADGDSLSILNPADPEYNNQNSPATFYSISDAGTVARGGA
jgi:hypothetical protein